MNIQEKPMNISQLAEALNKKPPWISKCVNHLKTIGFVDVNREGKRVYVNLKEGPMGASFTTLISEVPMLNLQAVLTGPGMQLLPLILHPGKNSKEITKRSTLSKRTVQGYIGRMRKMGVLTLNKGVYILSDRYKPLIEFINIYSYITKIKFLKEFFPDASIVWHQHDEFLFSRDKLLQDRRFISAATTRLQEMRYGIIAAREYYLYDPLKKRISKEEALVQSLLIDPENPRLVRIIGKIIKDKKINTKSLSNYAEKYGMMKKVTELI
jgi:predicted transcriptional regulator